MRPRRLAGASGRPLNFTVRCPTCAPRFCLRRCFPRSCLPPRLFKLRRSAKALRHSMDSSYGAALLFTFGTTSLVIHRGKQVRHLPGNMDSKSSLGRGTGTHFLFPLSLRVKLRSCGVNIPLGTSRMKACHQLSLKRATARWAPNDRWRGP